MEKKYLAPQVRVIARCEEDILTLSTTDSSSPMILDLKDLFH